MWACVFTVCWVAVAVEAINPFCFDIDKETGKQLCCPLENEANPDDSECVEYLPKDSLKDIEGVESALQFNRTNAYVVSPPENSDQSCCCLEEKERVLLETVVAEDGETYEVAQSYPDLVQPVDTVTCRLIPCILPESHRQDKSIRCSQKWRNWEVYAKDHGNANLLRIVNFKVPSGCLCASDEENLKDKALHDPSAYVSDIDLWFQTEVRRLILNVGNMYDIHSPANGSRTVKRQIQNMPAEAMSTVRILALILSKVEPSGRLKIFQEVKEIMNEKVKYMKEARMIIQAIFGASSTADETSGMGSSGGPSDINPPSQEKPPTDLSQEAEDSLKVKVIKFLLKRAMAEATCDATEAISWELDDYKKPPSFLPRAFVREMKRNENITVSPIACLLVSTALYCHDTDVMRAIKDGRLARMIVAAETVSVDIAKVLDNADGKIGAVFQWATGNTTATPLAMLDESKVREIQRFFDKVLEASDNNASTIISDTTVQTTVGHEKEATSEMPPQEAGTTSVITGVEITTVSNVTSGMDPLITAVAMDESTENPLIPPEDQLPPSEYLNFSDTGAVLSSFLNITGNPWFPMTDRPSTGTVAVEKPVTVAVTAEPVTEGETSSTSELQTEETLTPTPPPPPPTVTAGQMLDFTTELTQYITDSDDTSESPLSVTTEKFPPSVTDETPYPSLAVNTEASSLITTEDPTYVTEEETSASVEISTETTYTVLPSDISMAQTETMVNTSEELTEEAQSTTVSSTEETGSDDFVSKESSTRMTTEITVTEDSITEEMTEGTGTIEILTEVTIADESTTNGTVTEATVTGESVTVTEATVTGESVTVTEATATGESVTVTGEFTTEATVTEELTAELATEAAVIQELIPELATSPTFTEESTSKETTTEVPVTKESTFVNTTTESTPATPNGAEQGPLTPPEIPSVEDLPKIEYQPIDVPVEFIRYVLS